jgi:hypothetical protein
MLDNLRRAVRESMVGVDRITFSERSVSFSPSRDPLAARRTMKETRSEDAGETAFSERSVSFSPSRDPLAARRTMKETRSEDANR